LTVVCLPVAESRSRGAQFSGAPNKLVVASASIVPDAVVPRSFYRLKPGKTQSRSGFNVAFTQRKT
jgi:hypothetical protein